MAAEVVGYRAQELVGKVGGGVQRDLGGDRGAREERFGARAAGPSRVDGAGVVEVVSAMAMAESGAAHSAKVLRQRTYAGYFAGETTRARGSGQLGGAGGGGADGGGRGCL